PRTRHPGHRVLGVLALSAVGADQQDVERLVQLLRPVLPERAADVLLLDSADQVAVEPRRPRRPGQQDGAEPEGGAPQDLPPPPALLPARFTGVRLAALRALFAVGDVLRLVGVGVVAVLLRRRRLFGVGLTGLRPGCVVLGGVLVPRLCRLVCLLFGDRGCGFGRLGRFVGVGGSGTVARRVAVGGAGSRVVVGLRGRCAAVGAVGVVGVVRLGRRGRRGRRAGVSGGGLGVGGVGVGGVLPREVVAVGVVVAHRSCFRRAGPVQGVVWWFVSVRRFLQAKAHLHPLDTRDALFVD